ncbi:hypothetical protein CLV28_1359 [Sediminihabitans luteus]|uniref:Uncharacterized protein n=1 Tax=Sediminihabitans luteus TaxID=1138585 RepID=A0A2M9CPP8_9CELL|nr:hypothetical protein [Sediminihabitans luteus]PJJ73875.1 hypothetical protein CLV28_1359 [Sediminihabitans luteus]GII98213.1 hypothetical protein Slu03_05910 [Sediminihabitans luteus]
MLPIFAAPHQIDVMALWVGGPVADGGRPVYWFAHEIVQEWPNCYEWFLLCVTYARRSLERTRTTSAHTQSDHAHDEPVGGDELSRAGPPG